MIKKTSRGFEVVAKTGRTMGIYKSQAAADVRLKQIELFKKNAAERLKAYRLKKK